VHVESWVVFGPAWCLCPGLLNANPGVPKSNPLADKASKAWLDLGRYAREVLATQESRRFVLGFTLWGLLMRLWKRLSATMSYVGRGLLHLLFRTDSLYIVVARQDHEQIGGRREVLQSAKAAEPARAAANFTPDSHADTAGTAQKRRGAVSLQRSQLPMTTPL
jgi:hypothetical protein